MPDARIDRVHHGGGRRTEVPDTERVTVLVQRDSLDVDPGQRDVDAPGISPLDRPFGSPNVLL